MYLSSFIMPADMVGVFFITTGPNFWPRLNVSLINCAVSVRQAIRVERIKKRYLKYAEFPVTGTA